MYEKYKIMSMLLTVAIWLFIIITNVVDASNPEKHKAFNIMQFAFFIFAAAIRLSFNWMIDTSERAYDVNELPRKFFFDVISYALLVWMFGCSIANIDNLFTAAVLLSLITLPERAAEPYDSWLF